MRAPARRVDTDLQHGGPVRARVAVNVMLPGKRGEKVYIQDRELFGIADNSLAAQNFEIPMEICQHTVSMRDQ